MTDETKYTNLPPDELSFIIDQLSHLRPLTEVKERYENLFRKGIKVRTILDVIAFYDKEINTRTKKFIESGDSMPGAQRAWRQEVLQEIIMEALTERVVGVYKLGEHVEEIKKKDLSAALAAIKLLRDEQFEREKTDISKEKTVKTKLEDLNYMESVPNFVDSGFDDE